MKKSRILIVSTLLFLIITMGCITQKEAPAETLAPVITAAPTTAPPTTTSAPTTAPPTTTPAPTTTAPPTTLPPTTTPPPPTPTLSILNQQETLDPNGNVEVSGEVRNNWDMDVYDVQVSATFYDKYETELITKKSSPIDKLAPGASKSFKISSGYPKTTVDHYTLEAASPTITTTTTPPPTTAAPTGGLEITTVTEGTTLNGKLSIEGEIKNIGDKDMFEVQVSATFYDKYGNVLEGKKSFPIPKLTPGEARSFHIESNILKANIATYNLEAISQ